MELLAEAVDALVGMDPAVLADGEVIAELRRQIDRLEAVENRAIGTWDAEKAWAPSGAKTGAAWLAWRLHRPIDETRRWTRVARQLNAMPVTGAAWLVGEINGRHVSKLCAARRAETAEVFDRDEAQLVGNARTLSFAHFHRTVEYWLQHADPDGTEADADRQRDRRDGKGRALDVGEARCFTGATRRAVEVLGEECFEDTCETPAEDAQIDHIIEASKGGPTRTWNGRPACGFHNRARNRGP